MTKSSHHDVEIWNAFRQGDKRAYAQIYELHFTSLYSYGKKFISDDFLVEDAIQELFITLWRTKERLSAVDNIKFYLFRSLRRELHRLDEKEKSVKMVDFESFALTGIYQNEEHAELTDSEELSQKLTAVLKSLPKRQLEAITLRYYENFGIEEIASIMDISEKTVRNTLHNSLTLLRKNSSLFYTLIKLTLVYLWS